MLESVQGDTTKDLPRIHTMCLPSSFFPVESQDAPQEEEEEEESLGRALADLAKSREEVCREVRNAPKRRVDNEIADFQTTCPSSRCITMVKELAAQYTKRKWHYRMIGAGMVTGTAALGGGAFYLEAPMTVTAGLGVSGVAMTAFFAWWQSSALADMAAQLTRPENFEATFRKLYGRELADNDEYVISLWIRVKDHLKISVHAEDVSRLASTASGATDTDKAKLERLLDVEIPELRRGQPYLP